ncbi:MAG: FAD-dependent oxidoreductase [Burkholderiaceae bacterium]|jgi:monoamine oxidase|nr:FAD-dependent oxidoreductase [Burkholderiaceae bacterium]
MIRRRAVLGAAGAASLLAAAGCSPRDLDSIEGGFIGVAHERGHLLRTPWPARTPDAQRRAHTLIVGGGIAGLAAARALRLAGHDDFALLELEDTAGGNSRAAEVLGIACPQGAHYLPVPGDDAPEVQDLLEEFGLRRRVAGRWRYDERTLCHSPQERLFLDGRWQDGLLPVQGVSAATLAQYRRFAQAVEAAQQAARYAIPVRKSSFAPIQLAQDAIHFKAWLDQQGFTDPSLLWYLDYCCRDDFGAGIGTVSAWAGLHYFASRHGFHAPGERDESGDDAGLLTWPEGNAWLAERLAAPLGQRLHTGRVVGRIAQNRHGITVDALDVATHRMERWQAQQAVIALPVWVAARLLDPLPDAVRQRAAGLRTAPWLVANLRLRAPLQDRPGAAPSWDNVLYGSPGLGYVDAMHQSLLPVPGPTVLTYYRALGDAPQGRADLLQRPWTHWRDAILTELAAPHPDLAAQLLRIDITRHGHAMAIPVPGTLSQIARLRPTERTGALHFADAPRLAFAHADWSGYSVFEEAFTLGHAAGTALA